MPAYIPPSDLPTYLHTNMDACMTSVHIHTMFAHVYVALPVSAQAHGIHFNMDFSCLACVSHVCPKAQRRWTGRLSPIIQDGTSVSKDI